MKRLSMMKLLVPIASHMTDYDPELRGLSLTFDVWGGHGVQANNGLGRIRVFACESAWEAHCAGQRLKDPMVLGRRIVRHIAHEFRHCQQELLWETDIPSVHWNSRAAAFSGASIFGQEFDFLAYRNDPGEMDAKAFADKVVNKLDDNFIRFVGRYARWCCMHQWDEWREKETAKRTA